MTENHPDQDDGLEELTSADPASEWARVAGFQLERTETGAELWDASEEQPDVRPVAGVAEPVPDDQLRRWTLIWIGSAIGLALGACVLGLATNWFSEEFARLLLQLLVTPMVSAFIVVVGYLFGERRRG